MEKEKFESINKTFNYTPNSVFTNQWSSLAFGIGMVVVPLIYPFGLRIRCSYIVAYSIVNNSCNRRDIASVVYFAEYAEGQSVDCTRRNNQGRR